MKELNDFLFFCILLINTEAFTTFNHEKMKQAENCMPTCRCELSIDQNSDVDQLVDQIQEQGSGWGNPVVKKSKINNWELKIVCQKNSSYLGNYYQSKFYSQLVVPTTNLKKLEIIGDFSVIKPLDIICNIYPNLETLILKEANFSEVSKFTNINCFKTLHLQSVNLKNLDWLENLSISLTNINKLWLGGNIMEEGRLRGYTFSLLRNLQSLRLNETGIYELDDDVFFNLSELKQLDLSDNFLSSVPRKALAPLVKLEELNLNKNWISRIAPFDLNKFMNLKIISLTQQNDQLIIIDRESFGVLPMLTKLNLQGNTRLAYIHPDAFLHCPQLAEINIKSSVITTIDESMIKGLSKLTKLIINSKHIKCDCQIKWIYNTTTACNLNTDVRNSIEKLRCAKPIKHEGKELINVVKDEPDICKPSISQTFEGSVLINNLEIIHLHCRANGKPRAKISWILPSGKIVRNSVQAKAHNVLMNNLGSLTLNQRSSEGFYICKATSTYESDEKGCFVINPASKLEPKSTLKQTPISNRYLPAPIITSASLHIGYVSIEWKHSSSISSKNYLTTIKAFDQNDKTITQNAMTRSDNKFLIQEVLRYDIRLPKMTKLQKVCIEVSCCKPVMYNQTCVLLRENNQDNLVLQVDNVKKKGSVVVVLCLCLSLFLMVSGIGACSNSFLRKSWFTKSRYTKLERGSNLEDKVHLHEISAPLINEVVGKKTNLLINTSSSFSYSC